ncbi:MAG: T9SS type A sorting domain-containing protein [Ignavibacteriaceae bacterium]
MKGLIFTAILIFTNVTFSQNPNPLDFFPHHKGDIFEYADKSESGYFQSIITKDSLSEDGKYYVQTINQDKWTIDTIKHDVYLGYQTRWLEFKLDADSGDVWTVFDDSSTGFVRAKVVDVFLTYVLGEEVVIKYIEYTSYEYVDTTQGLYAYAYYLSSKFGIVSEYGDPPGIPTHYLRGAKIDGKIYGTITSIEDGKKVNPIDFTLKQNYPNPFNPSTTIEYALPENSSTTLKIYNTLGEEVKTLIDEYQMKGNYKIKFDARNLPSGVYFYKLTTDEVSLTKKMLLIH